MAELKLGQNIQRKSVPEAEGKVGLRNLKFFQDKRKNCENKKIIMLLNPTHLS